MFRRAVSAAGSTAGLGGSGFACAGAVASATIVAAANDGNSVLMVPPGDERLASNMTTAPTSGL
jgi:hypothetical protein